MGMFDKRLVSLGKSIAKLDKEITDLEAKKASVQTPAARLAVQGMVNVAAQRRARLMEEQYALQQEEKRQTEIPGTAAEPQPPGSIPGRKR